MPGPDEKKIRGFRGGRFGRSPRLSRGRRCSQSLPQKRNYYYYPRWTKLNGSRLLPSYEYDGKWDEPPEVPDECQQAGKLAAEEQHAHMSSRRAFTPCPARELCHHSRAAIHSTGRQRSNCVSGLVLLHGHACTKRYYSSFVQRWSPLVTIPTHTLDHLFCSCKMIGLYGVCGPVPCMGRSGKLPKT